MFIQIWDKAAHTRICYVISVPYQQLAWLSPFAKYLIHAYLQQRAVSSG